jgi:tryptophan-rich sensory protein
MSILACLSAGAVGSFFTGPAIPTWYASLTKPSFNPPNWVFGPVWTLLYILMGIAAYLVWRRGFGDPQARIALVFFLVQLVLNAAWSALFFGLQSPPAALAEIIVLWVAILVTTVLFWRVTPLSGVLLLPYLGWVSFASILNAAIVRLNA